METLVGGVKRRINGHGGPCPSRGIPKSEAAQPIRQVGRDRVLAVRENIGHRRLRPSRRAFAPQFFQSSRTATFVGDVSRRMNGHEGQCRSRGSPNRRHPSPFARSGGTASPPSSRISGTEECAPPARSHGRDGVPAVWENTGRRGLRPSRTSSNRGHPSTLACPVGAASSRSARKGRPRTLLRNLQRDSNGQCPCELRQVGRDGAPAVRRNVGRRGPCPSCAIATLPGRCGIARPGRPACWRSAGRRL
jgi:hypothetical protein